MHSTNVVPKESPGSSCTLERVLCALGTRSAPKDFPGELLHHDKVAHDEGVVSSRSYFFHYYLVSRTIWSFTDINTTLFITSTFFLILISYVLR